MKPALNLKRHRDPVALLTAFTLLLLGHILRSPGTYGMADTDNEGTLWWLWSKCNRYSSNGVLTRVGWPTGFDTRDFATFNLVDELRARAASLGGCSPESVVWVFAAFPVVALGLNLIGAYFLGWKVFRSRSWALILAITGVATSQILLATRTSLANNLLAPGLLALAYGFTYLDKRKPRDAWLAACCLCIQMLCNAYNGAMFLLVLIVLSLSWTQLSRRRELLVLPITAIIGSLVGLSPLMSSQLFLITSSSRRDLIRPVNLDAELVDPLVLFSRNYHWFTSIIGGRMPTPEAGWLSIFVLLLGLISVGSMFMRHVTHRTRRLAVGSLASAALVVLISCDVPGSRPLHSIYATFGSPFRGVSNYLKVVPLMLALGGLAILKERLERRTRSHLMNSIVVGVLLVLSGLNFWDSIPRSPTFRERTSLDQASEFYRSLSSSGSVGVTAHFPDYTYQPDWGLPLRFIQVAQMYTDNVIANGRDFQHRQSRFASLPSPVNRTALVSLRKRGITQIVLHKNLIDPVTLDESVRFLESLGLRGVRYESPSAASGPEINRGLDIIVFDVQPFKQTSSVWTPSH